MKYLLALSIFLTSNLAYGVCTVPCYESYKVDKLEYGKTQVDIIKYTQHNIFGLQNLKGNTVEIPINLDKDEDHIITLVGQCSQKYKIRTIKIVDKQGEVCSNKFGEAKIGSGNSICLHLQVKDPGQYTLLVEFEKKCKCEDCKCTPNNHCGCLD